MHYPDKPTLSEIAELHLSSSRVRAGAGIRRFHPREQDEPSRQRARGHEEPEAAVPGPSPLLPPQHPRVYGTRSLRGLQRPGPGTLRLQCAHNLRCSGPRAHLVNGFHSVHDSMKFRHFFGFSSGGRGGGGVASVGQGFVGGGKYLSCGRCRGNAFCANDRDLISARERVCRNHGGYNKCGARRIRSRAEYLMPDTQSLGCRMRKRVSGTVVVDTYYEDGVLASFKV